MRNILHTLVFTQKRLLSYLSRQDVFVLTIIILLNLFFSQIAHTQLIDAVESENLEDINPRYSIQNINIASINSVLAVNNANSITLPLPLPNRTISFELVPNQVLSKDLQLVYPSLKTYDLLAENGDYYGKLTLSNAQLYGFIHTPDGAVIIRPSTNNAALYESYYTDVEPALLAPQLDCEINSNGRLNPISTPIISNARGPAGFSTGTTKRIYRVAIVTTEEFGNEHGANAMTVITNTVNTWNMIYEKDISVQFQLVGTKIYTSSMPSSPFLTLTDQNGGDSRTNQAAEVVQGNFLLSSYDIGHVFHYYTSSISPNWSGGGVAGLGVVCNDSNRSPDMDIYPGAGKGAGWSGSFNNTSNGWFQLSAHEIGHMFGAEHTFNGTGSSCTNNISSNNAYEIASGTTIMSYSGICGSTYNISDGGTADNYFHSASIQQMIAHIDNSATCYTTSGSNNLPTVNADPCSAGTITIPTGTPFTLSGTATDIDEDALEYTWEQIDEDGAGTTTQGATLTQTGASGLTAGNSPTAPLFRAFPPSSEGNIRTFPSNISGISTEFEVLPQVARTMSFALTARDGNGGVACENRTIQVANGPLIVGTPCGGGNLTAGSTVNLPLTVNGSTCTTAKVYLSIDDGISFSYDLGTITYSTGNKSVTIPNSVVETTSAKFKVVCEDNPCAQFFQLTTSSCTISSNCLAPPSEISPTTAITLPQEDVGLNNLGLSNNLGAIVSNFSGSISTDDTQGALVALDGTPASCTVSGNSPYYETFPFSPDASGAYTFTHTGAFGLVLNLYDAPFNGTDCTNHISSSATRPSGSGNFIVGSNVSANLTAGQNYVLVISGFSSSFPTLPAAYTINFTKPSGANIYDGAIVPSGYDYTYTAVNTSNNQVVAHSATSDFSNLEGGIYEIYGIAYKGSGGAIPANVDPATFIGQTINNILGNNCLLFSSNKKSLTIIANCSAIGALNGTANICSADNTTSLTASSLTNMGSTYGVKFVYSTTQQSNATNIYGLSNNLGTVANANLTSSNTIATLANVNYPATPNTYYTYAILTPSPSDAACRPFQEFAVTVNSGPTFAMGTVNNPSICNGSDGSIQLTGLTANTTYSLSYKKNSEAPVVSTLNSNSSGEYVITNLQAAAYTEINITLNDCMSTNASQSLTDPAGSTAAVISGTTAICNGQSADIAVTITGGVSPYTLAYSNGSSNTTINNYISGTAIAVSPTATTTYSIVSISDANTCSGTGFSGSAVITVHPIPNPTLGTIINPTTCGGTDGSIQLTGLLANTSYSLSYKKNSGTAVVTTITSNNTGEYILNGLDAATYAEINVTLNNCTSTNLSQTITNPNSSTAAVMSGTTTICNGQNTNIAVAITGGVSPYTLVYSDGSTNTTINNYTSGTTISVSPTATTTYSIISVTGANLCAGTGNTEAAIITVNPIPTFTVGTVTNPTVCSGSDGSIQLTGLTANTTYSLAYKKNNGTAIVNIITANGSGEYIITNLEAATYTEINITLNGCTSVNGSQSLTDPTGSTAAIISGTTAICNGQSADIAVTITDGVSPYTLVYADGSSNTTINNYISGTAIAVNPTATTTYSIVSVSDANTCSGTGYTGSAVITVHPIPNPALGIITNPTTCGGTDGSIQLTGLLANTNYSLSYQKNNGTAVVSTITSNNAGEYILTDLDAATYTEINVTNNSCISSNLSQTITAPNSSTAAVISGTTAICNGQNTNIAVAITGGVSPYTLVYSDGSTNTTINNYTSGTAISVSPTVTTTYSIVSVTDANLCAGTGNTGTAVITVNPIPTFTIGAVTNPTACSGSDGSIQLTGLTANTTYSLSYKKNSEAPVVSTVNSNSSGEYVITNLQAAAYTEINVTLNGCISTNTSQSLTDPAGSTAAVISGTTAICNGQSADIAVTITGGVSPYTLAYSNGSSNTTINNYISGTAIAVSPTATITYSVVSISDANTCSGAGYTGSAVITVYPIPNPALGIITNPTTCGGTDGSIQLTGLLANTTYSLSYKKNSGTAVVTTITSNNAGEYLLTGLDAATYTEINVTLNNCTSTNLSQTITDPNSSTAAVISGTTTICDGQSTDIAVAITGGVSPYTLVYSDGSTNTTINNYTSGTTISVSPTATTTYSIISVTDANLCAGTGNTGTAIITVNPIPTFIIGAVTNPTACSGSDGSIQLTGLTANTTYSLSYKKNSEAPVVSTVNSNSLGEYVITNLNAATYTEINVTLNGCISTNTSQSLTDPAGSTATVISGTTAICNGQSADISVVITGGVSPYTLVYADGSNNTTINNYISGTTIAVSPTATTTYSIVSISDANTCSGTGYTGSAVITVHPIPNPALGTIINPTMCGGTDGSIQLTGLLANTSYSLSYKKNSGTAVVTTITSNNTGEYILNGLDAATYAEINVTLNNCNSTNLSQTITDPNSSTAAVISGTTAICDGQSTDIAVAITGGVSPYTLVYSDGSTNTTINNYTNGTTISVNPTTTTTYSIVSVTGANLCAGTGNTGAAIITVNPIPTFTVGAVTNPSACSGSDGSIQLTGLTANTTYSLSYKKNSEAPVVSTVNSNSLGEYVITNLNAANYTEINVTLNGCISTNTSQSLTDPAGSTAAVISGTTAICNGQSADIAVTITGGVSPYTLVYADGSNNTTINNYISGTAIAVSPTATTTYSVVSISDANTCLGAGYTGSAVITVHPIPNPALGIITNPTTCGGTDGSIQLTGLLANTSYSLSYKKNSGTAVVSAITSNNTGEYTLTGLDAATYTEINVTNNSCTSSNLSQIITDPNSSTAAVLNGTTAICNGQSANISVSITGGQSPYTLVYSNGSTNTTINNYTSGTTISVSPVATTTYSIVSVTGANLCAGTGNTGAAIITVNPIPTFTVGAVTNPSACSGSDGSIQLTGLTANTTYSLSYKKNSEVPVVSTVNSNSLGEYVITNLNTANYTEINVTLNGCISTNTSQSLTDPAGSTAAVISGTTAICNGQSADIAVTIAGGVSPYTLVYADGSNNTTINNYISGTAIAVSPTATTTYSVVSISDANTCLGAGYTGSAVITVHPIPNPTLGTIINPTTCGGTDGSIQLTGLLANTNYSLSYQKNNGTAVVSTITSNNAGEYILTDLAAATYTEINVTNNSCTSSNLSQTITDPNSSTAAVISGTTAICNGQNTNIAVAITGGVSPYTLVYSDGSTNTTINNYTSGTTISVSPTATTTYSIISVTGANLCAGTGNTGTAVITVNSIPTFTIGAVTNPSACSGSDGSIQLTELTASASYSLSYKKNNGTAIVATVTTNGSGEYIITNLEAAAYTEINVTLNGCTSVNASQSLTDPTGSTAAIISGTTAICNGQSTDMAVVITGGLSPYTLVYSNGSSNTTINNYISGTAIAVSPTTTTTYSIVSVTSANLCTGSGNTGAAIVTIHPPTVNNITLIENSGSVANDGNICLGGQATLSTDGIGTYRWSTGETTNSINVTSADNYSVTVTDGNNCSSTASQVINVDCFEAASGNLLEINEQLSVLTSGIISNLTINSASIFAPCSCRNNTRPVINGVTTNTGLFNDEIIIMSTTSGDKWQIKSSSEIYHYDNDLSKQVMDLTLVQPTDPLTEIGNIISDGVTYYVYRLPIIHQDAIGYSAVLETTNRGYSDLFIGNTCYYPEPIINNLALSYPLISDPITLTATANNVTGVGQFFIDDIPQNSSTNSSVSLTFNPGNLGVGNHTLKYLFDAGIAGSMDINNPGCQQEIEQTINIRNMGLRIVDPCSCLGNATSPTSGDGQFVESVTIMAPSGQTWYIESLTGFYRTPLNGSRNPLALTEFITGVNGDLFVETPMSNGMSEYTLHGLHVDNIGYTIMASNGVSSLPLSNTCYYEEHCFFDLITDTDATPKAPTLDTCAQVFEMPTDNIERLSHLKCCEANTLFRNDGAFLYEDTSARQDVYTICPQTIWQTAYVSFNEFDVAIGDTLFVFDGADRNATLIGKASGDNVSAAFGGWVTANCAPEINPTGCLTFEFKTNGDYNKSSGWRAWVSCNDRGLTLNIPILPDEALNCGESYKVLTINPATLTTTCGTITNDSTLVRITNIHGEICVDTCLSDKEALSYTDTFGVGFYFVEYKLKSDITKTAKGQFSVNPRNLVCNDQVTIAIDESCSVIITPDLILENPCDTIQDTFFYEISIKNPDGLIIASGGGKLGAYPTLSKDEIKLCSAEAYTVEITQKYYEGLNLTFCNNGIQQASCTTEVIFEDQTIPTIIGNRHIDTLINCTAEFNVNQFEFTRPTAFDNCDSVNLTFTSAIPLEAGNQCTDIQTYLITWTATDLCKNTNTLVDTAVIIRPNLTQLVKVMDVELSCGENEEETLNELGIPSLQTGKLKNGVFIPTDTVPLNTNNYVCNYILIETNEEATSDCGNKKYKYWSIVDWCDGDSGPIEIDTQLITFIDTIPPTIICGSANSLATALLIDLPDTSCVITPNLPLPTAIDLCDNNPTVVDYELAKLVNGNWEYLAASLAEAGELESDTFRVGYRAFDNCSEFSLADSCYQYFIIKDQIAPTAICTDELIISIGSDFARVFAKDISQSSKDNCGIAHYLIRKTSCSNSSIYEGETNDLVSHILGDNFDAIGWEAFVDFTCCDVQQKVRLEVLVIDNDGNHNICWLDVIPEDKVAPTCTPLPDVNTDCKDFHTDELGASTDTNNNNTFDVTEWQPLTEDLAILYNERFGNPLANCQDNLACAALQLSQEYQLIGTQCGISAIKRRYRVRDVQGIFSNWVTQHITIDYEAKWQVTFPTDWQGVCGDSIPNSDLILTNGACDLLAVEQEDQLFADSTDCYKVARTFYFINWCNYVAGSEPIDIPRPENIQGKVATTFFISAKDYQNLGYFKYTQILKITDDTAPLLTLNPVDTCIKSEGDALPYGEEDQTPGATPFECDARKTFSITASDCIPSTNLNFSWQIFKDNVLVGTGITNTFDWIVEPTFNYLVRWEVADGCGNVTTETEQYTFKDCSTPTPYCINGYAITLTDGAAAIWASDFNQTSYDNCSNQNNLRFKIYHTSLGIPAPTTYAGVEMLPTNLKLDCQYLGTQSVLMYVLDEAGNFDFCSTSVIIQDNDNSCKSGENLTVTGTISNRLSAAIAGAKVVVQGKEQNSVTTETGLYQFTLSSNENYTIEVEMDTLPLNGVSTYDLVVISQHILGIKTFESPYQYIAADVNQSGTITAFDLVQIRQLILNLVDKFPDNKSWKFVDSRQKFLTDAPAAEVLQETIYLENITKQQTAIDFVGIKIGDVDGTAKTNSFQVAEERNKNIFSISTKNQLLKKGETYTVQFDAAAIAQISGYQFTLNHPSLTLNRIIPGLANIDNFGLHFTNQNSLTTSWYTPVINSIDHTLFSLVFEANTDGYLSDLLTINSTYTIAEAYAADGTKQSIELNFNTAQQATFELYQNKPNPFKGHTIVSFQLPKATAVELQIIDYQGRVVKTYKQNFTAGKQDFFVNLDQLSKGTYYYQLMTEFGIKGKKMIIVE